jgi:hypothetical protein
VKNEGCRAEAKGKSGLQIGKISKLRLGTPFYGIPTLNASFSNQNRLFKLKIKPDF